MTSIADLHTRLAAVLPRGRSLTIHHLSTPPTKADPLYSAPPGERPDRTYRENHFLAVSVDTTSSKEVEVATPERRRQVLILGVEILLYSSAKSTTIFVSKADSTGYLSLLNLPQGTPSPIREVIATFISLLVDTRQRKNIPVILSLFARSQSQYLFPGSVENGNKHVLDDRGLIKWWCKVLDPMLASRGRARAYIAIPGLDAYETKSFPPRESKNWAVGIPLDRLSHYAKEYDWVPPRCLIPHFPDDPKSRFRDELDEEARGSGVFKTTGSWKSVKSLDMFWEMMAYRQECSSGRITGFIWVVFDDESTTLPESASMSSNTNQEPQTPQAQCTVVIRSPSTTPRKLISLKDEPSLSTKLASAKREQKKLKNRYRKRLTGPIILRTPRIKTEQRNYLVEKTPSHTKYYAWPVEGRGELVVSEKDYKRMLELLLHLDFATLEKGAGSTRRWVSEVGLGRNWGYNVNGKMIVPTVNNSKSGHTEEANDLSALVKRKRTDSALEAKTLEVSLVRKKSRSEDSIDSPKEGNDHKDVRILGTGLDREKTEETTPSQAFVNQK